MRAEGMTWVDYSRDVLKWGNWAITRRKDQGYDTVLTPKQYEGGQRAYLHDGGDPDQVDYRTAIAAGYRQIWVRAAS